MIVAGTTVVGETGMIAAADMTAVVDPVGGFPRGRHDGGSSRNTKARE